MTGRKRRDVIQNTVPKENPPHEETR